MWPSKSPDQILIRLTTKYGDWWGSAQNTRRRHHFVEAAFHSQGIIDEGTCQWRTLLRQGIWKTNSANDIPLNTATLNRLFAESLTTYRGKHAGFFIVVSSFYYSKITWSNSKIKHTYNIGKYSDALMQNWTDFIHARWMYESQSWNVFETWCMIGK